MARLTHDGAAATPATPTTAAATGPRFGIGLRDEFVRYGRSWSNSLAHLVTLSARLDDSGEWALDGSPTCAHWIAATLDIEVCTAREWVRIGKALRMLDRTCQAFNEGALSFTKVRSLTRIATPDNELELLEIAERTPAGHLGRALSAWSARHDDEDTQHERQRRDRGLSWRTEPDGMVVVSARLTPEQAAVFIAAIDAQVMRADGADSVVDSSTGVPGITEGATTQSANDATASRGSHRAWPSLGQQRVDALVHLLGNGGAGVRAEVILHVRADGCTLDDGTPIAESVVERIAETAVLRAMIHDAESHPVNVSGRHRRHTDRQKRVVKERDRRCVDCGGEDFLEYKAHSASSTLRSCVAIPAIVNGFSIRFTPSSRTPCGASTSAV